MWWPCIKMVVIPKNFILYFVQPLELKLKVCTSRAKIMKIVSVSKYIYMDITVILHVKSEEMDHWAYLTKADLTI